MSKIDDILPALHEVLNCVKGDWMIIGTSSLYLSGHSVAPNDIDILADKGRKMRLWLNAADGEVLKTQAR